MAEPRDPAWVYNETVRMFAIGGDPPHESPAEMQASWGRAWGLSNDVGRIRSILMHRPGPEMGIVDPSKRIERIGSYGDLDEHWYFQSEEPPDIPGMQAQHDAFVAALERRGVEIIYQEGVGDRMLKAVYTRDPLQMVKGGAIVNRMGTRIRRGEELVTTRTLAKHGIPILRTLNGSAVMEGGTFAWLNEKTAVIGCGVRVNREGARQVGEVLAAQGVELIVIDLVGYDIHLDVGFLMVDRDLALVNPMNLPYAFLQTLRDLGIDTVEITPEDDGWICNGLAVAPRELLIPEGASERTLEELDRKGVAWEVIPYDKVHLNGGGLHCSTTPLIRDPV
ncbi:MAG: dimethylarginine dimethylaminohydrolase family protein [Gaiellales bacterium]